MWSSLMWQHQWFGLLTASSKNSYLSLDGLRGVPGFTLAARIPDTLIFPLIPPNTSVTGREETAIFGRRIGLNPNLNVVLMQAVFHAKSRGKWAYKTSGAVISAAGSTYTFRSGSLLLSLLDLTKENKSFFSLQEHPAPITSSQRNGPHLDFVFACGKVCAQMQRTEAQDRKTSMCWDVAWEHPVWGCSISHMKEASGCPGCPEPGRVTGASGWRIFRLKKG